MKIGECQQQWYNPRVVDNKESYQSHVQRKHLIDVKYFK